LIDLVVPGDRDRASLPDCGGACHAPRPARMIAQGAARLNLRNRTAVKTPAVDCAQAPAPGHH